jgi:transposase
VALLRKKLFGKSSEKRSKTRPDDQVFDEAKASAEDLLKDDAIRESSQKFDDSVGKMTVTEATRQARKKGRKPISGEYFRTDVIHDLSEENKICTCGMHLKNIGEDVSEQLDVIPAKICLQKMPRHYKNCTCSVSGHCKMYGSTRIACARCRYEV